MIDSCHTQCSGLEGTKYEICYNVCAQSVGMSDVIDQRIDHAKKNKEYNLKVIGIGAAVLVAAVFLILKFR